MTDLDLAWAVEEACLNAWPAPRQILCDRWLLRAAGGPSRRINSVNPLRASSYDPEPVIATATPLYAALGRPLVFRVAMLAEGLEQALERLGFVGRHPVRTLFASLGEEAGGGDAGVELADAPSPGWLALRARLNDEDPADARTLRAVLEALLLPRAFASLQGPDGTAAIAFGALHRGLLVVEAVATDPALRGRGYARRIVGALMAWAAGQGARGACLQVVADNAPALRLYEALGFRTDLYDYAYWTREPLA